METHSYQLAEINIAQTRAALDDPILADFVSQFDAVNKLAEKSAGFVWRLKAESGSASSYITAFDNERIVINISVWESVDALRVFVYKNHHGEVYRNREKWFEPLAGSPLALWWIPHGQTPTIEEGKARLETLSKCGPTSAAFTSNNYSRRQTKPETPKFS